MRTHLQQALLTDSSRSYGADTSSRKSTVLALFTLWLFWFLVFADAKGASVIVTDNVKFNVSTGNAVTTLRSVSLAKITETSGNNTIAFNISGYELTVGEYKFTVTSYGNGTLTLVFNGIIPSVVISTSSTNSYVAAKSLEQVQYTTNQASTLDVLFNGPGLASTTLFVTVTMMGGFMGVIGILGGFKMAREPQLIKRRVIMFTVIGYMIAAVVLATVAIIIRGS